MSEYSTGKRIATTSVLMCDKTKKKFGARLEKIAANTWEMTWSYKISSAADVGNQFSNEKIQGSIKIPDKYPGCPWCKGKMTVVCTNGCGKIYCHNTENGMNTSCPWCGFKGVIGGPVSTGTKWSGGTDYKG